MEEKNLEIVQLGTKKQLIFACRQKGSYAEIGTTPTNEEIANFWKFLFDISRQPPEMQTPEFVFQKDQEMDIAWRDRKSELGAIRAANYRGQWAEIDYLDDQAEIDQQALNLEIEQGRAYLQELANQEEEELQSELREMFRVTPEKIAAYLQVYSGHYLFYDDLIRLFMPYRLHANQTTPYRLHANQTTLRSKMSLQFSPGGRVKIEDVLKRSGLKLYTKKCTINGRPRMVIVALPEGEGPEWSESELTSTVKPDTYIGTANKVGIKAEQPRDEDLLTEFEDQTEIIKVLENHLRKGVLIIRALKAGVSASKIAEKAHMTEEEVLALGEKASAVYREIGYVVGTAKILKNFI